MGEDPFKGLFRIPAFLYEIWKKIPRTEILNQESTIDVPESTAEYSMFIKIPPDFRSLRKPIKFDDPSITSISVCSLAHAFPHTLRDVIVDVVGSQGTVYILFPERLPSECDMISVTTKYRILDASIIDNLVDRKWAHEPSGPERNQYWMTAKLKHPKALSEDARYGRFDLEDVDVTVDVGVHNELKTIPSALVQRVKAFFDVMNITDPRQQYKALPRLRHLALSGTAGKEFRILVDVESLFEPDQFSKYVDVIQDFRYSTCYKGKEFYELPIPMIPKKMNVISRANLTLEKPTAEGNLIYKNSVFIDAIRGIVT